MISSCPGRTRPCRNRSSASARTTPHRALAERARGCAGDRLHVQRRPRSLPGVARRSPLRRGNACEQGAPALARCIPVGGTALSGCGDRRPLRSGPGEGVASADADVARQPPPPDRRHGLRRRPGSGPSAAGAADRLCGVGLAVAQSGGRGDRVPGKALLPRSAGTLGLGGSGRDRRRRSDPERRGRGRGSPGGTARRGCVPLLGTRQSLHGADRRHHAVAKHLLEGDRGGDRQPGDRTRDAAIRRIGGRHPRRARGRRACLRREHHVVHHRRAPDGRHTGPDGLRERPFLRRGAVGGRAGRVDLRRPDCVGGSARRLCRRRCSGTATRTCTRTRRWRTSTSTRTKTVTTPTRTKVATPRDSKGTAVTRTGTNTRR